MSVEKVQEVASGITARVWAWGVGLALLLASTNAYVTLKIGVMEEGAALSFLMFMVYIKIFRLRDASKAEAVMVATMGSAGGSLSFLANFFAAMTISGRSLTMMEMTVFSITTSLVGLAMAVPLRQIYVVKDPLRWPTARVVMTCVDSVLEATDSLQPRVLAFFGGAAVVYVFLSAGLEKFPEALIVTSFGMASYKIGLACSPMVIGAGYLIGLRVGMGFLFGGLILFVMGPYIPRDLETYKIVAPNMYLWPGVAALTAAGLTGLAINGKVVWRALKSLRGMLEMEEKDRIMSGRALIAFIAISFVTATLVLSQIFGVVAWVAFLILVFAGLILNLIATRAAGETAFNPVRVMGVMGQGLAWMCGVRSMEQVLLAAGIPAGAIGQSGLFVQDAYFGRHYGVKAKTQLFGQAAVLIPASLALAWTYTMLAESYGVGDPTTAHPNSLTAPVAAMWSVMAKVFTGDFSKFPPYAVQSMVIGAIAGVAFCLFDNLAKRGLTKSGGSFLWKLAPHSLGITLGMILPIWADTAFFAGSLLLCVVLPIVFNLRKDDEDPFLTTIASAGIIGEGVGGLVVGVCKYVGWL